MKIAKLFIAASIILTTSPVLAQNVPSYDETVAFIRSKVNMNDGQNRVFRFIENEKCTFTYSLTLLVGFDDSPVEGSIDATFNLSDLDPSKIYFKPSSNPSFPDGGAVNIETREAKKSIRKDWKFYDTRKSLPAFITWNANNMCRRVDLEDNYSIGTINPQRDNGPRVARALQHLVKLCGGKEELF